MKNDAILAIAGKKLDQGLYFGKGRVTRATDNELIDFARELLTTTRATPAADVRDAASPALLQELDYAIVHGWPFESEQRLARIRNADKARAAIAKDTP